MKGTAKANLKSSVFIYDDKKGCYKKTNLHFRELENGNGTICVYLEGSLGEH